MTNTISGVTVDLRSEIMRRAEQLLMVADQVNLTTFTIRIDVPRPLTYRELQELRDEVRQLERRSTVIGAHVSEGTWSRPGPHLMVRIDIG